MNQALIIKLIGGLYSFKNLKTGEIYEGYARGKFRKFKVDETSSFNKNKFRGTKKEVKDITLSPKVGDLIDYEYVSGQYIITHIHQRKNELIRPDVANVDQVLLVFSATRPEFSFRLLDKFLVILEYHELKPIIVVSKIDLLTDDELEKLKNQLKYYESYYEIYYVNSKQKIGFDILENVFSHKITVLAGQTGVGKSTLLNALIPELQLKTQEISLALGRGKHTTRHSEIYPFKDGYIADTPGFSKLEFEFHDYEMIKNYFVDFVELSSNCKFGSKCNHLQEPDCMVKLNVIKSDILKSRYQSYLDFVNELKERKVKY